MKLIIKIVLLFILAIIIAAVSSYGPGHVILFIGEYRLDLSFATLLVIILVVYIILHYASMFFGGVYNIPGGIRQRRHNMALIKSRNYFNLAATNYFKNEYQSAYNNALKSISQNVLVSDKFPVLLLAIDAINLMNDDDKKTLIRLNKLLTKFPTNEEKSYVRDEMIKINKTRNNRLYTEFLAKL
ncbi:MAG TPA: heme biosynthesis HemY N-terminal domain-containing protein [Aquella sp.]|nr:heme biosynthesis HemY N-terminal domain-containing protein [Aquella sp.]